MVASRHTVATFAQGLLGVLAGALLALGSPRSAEAGTYTVTVQSTPATGDDALLKQENATEKNGDKPELRVKSSTSSKHKHAAVSVSLPDLSGKSVLQAWLNLYQFAGSSQDEPADVRVYPLSESWTEAEVAWRYRYNAKDWTTAGGTRETYWTDRRLVSAATNGSMIGWQVGPIVNDWNLGVLPNNGFLVEPVHGATDREEAFRSSEYTTTPSQTPQLVIQYTDEAPAIVRGYAEIQPSFVLKGATNLPWTVWLDVDAEGKTESGTATGFDLITIAHAGALRGRNLDSLIIGGTNIPLGQVVWYDNGTSITVRHPKTNIVGRVKLVFHIDVLATQPEEIPVYVDDTTTSGAWQQILWPRDADGAPGNGDTWLLSPTATISALELQPDSLTTVVGQCTQFTLYATDDAGNRFPATADSFQTYVYNGSSYVLDPSIGTTDATGLFCARKATTSSTVLVAWYGTTGPQIGYAFLTINPARTPLISSVTLRNRAGSAVTSLVPQDTMFVDVTLSDGDGFKDIRGLDFGFFFAGHANDVSAPAFHAAYRWRRSVPTPFTIQDPVGTSWTLLPSLCSIDTTTNSTAAQTVRLAFRPGAIARASSAGEWTALVTATSATPLDTTSASRTGLSVPVRLTAAWDDTAGAFNAGSPGATNLPLRDPPDGKLDFRILSNTAYDLEATVSDLAGLTTTSDTLRVGSPTKRVSWSFSSDRAAGGRLDTSYGALAAAQPASTLDPPSPQNLYLWLDLPSSIPPQDYRGRTKIRLAAAGGLHSAEQTAPITATVSSSGQAAQSALGEVLPNSVQVGVAGQTFSAYLLPTFNLLDTGIDRIRISVPNGYGPPAVTSVRVNGVAVGFTDASQPGVAEANLATNVVYAPIAQVIEVRFSATTPTQLDSLGSNFVMQFDDLGTARPPQVATEGDANGANDGNDWKVVVNPGSIASIAVTPDSVALYPGDSQAFTATAADAYGHPLSPSFAWSTTGGVGNLIGSGFFTATSVGSGRVIASSGGFADTAKVTVRPSRGIEIVALSAPTALYQGQDSALVRLTIANLGADSVRLDTLALRFTHVTNGDADGDFTYSSASGNPAGIGGLDTVTVRLLLRVHRDATTGTVTVNGRVVAGEVASGIVVRDDAAPAPVTAFVSPGGVSLAASQVPAAVLPGGRNVAFFSLALTNHYPELRALRSLQLVNGTTGTGDEDQRDAELGEVALYKDDGDGVLEAGADTLLLPTIALSGSVTFAPLNLSVGSGGTVRLLVVSTRIPLSARDGDVVDFSLSDSTGVTFDRSVYYRTPWPLAPAGTFPIDGMAAAQVVFDPVQAVNLLAGTTNNPALEILVPPNGYEADRLQRIAVVNYGNAESGIDIARVRAWVDSDGNGQFQAAQDRSLGDLVYTGDRWQRTGLSETIPLEGLRVFVTVDVADLARQARTVQLGIPEGLDAGLGVQSGNSGPRDAPVRNPSELAISTVDRMTLTATLVEAAQVRPGERNVVLHHFTATNSYSSARTMTDLAFTNATVGPGGVAQLDGEIESATLFVDGNGDGLLGGPSQDPPLGTSFFSGGRALFTGLNASIPAGSSVHFLLTVDVARNAARDGDALSATVAGPTDVGFLEPTTITSAWPVDSRARASVDGMIAAQITNIGASGVTLGPSDGPAVALNVVVPGNGYAEDVLQSLAVVNLGSATDTTGIEELRLWADGGDGVFSAGAGDDRDLGAMTHAGDAWRSPVLSDSSRVSIAGQRLFVSLRTSATPDDSVTVRLAIPFDGVAMQSGNSGPLDEPVENPQSILISTSPLLATIETGSASSTVGQPITVRMAVRNAGTETVTGITPSLLGSGGANAVLDAGPVPPSVNLAPAEIDTFVWTYHSNSAGNVQFAGSAQGMGATSGLLRRAFEAVSNVHRVYLAAADLALAPVQSMPFSVTRGQTGVVPFSLTLTNGGGTGASDIRLRSFRIRLEDESGAGIVPAELLTRVAVNEGTNVYLARTSLESTGSTVDLTLASPLPISVQEPVTISVRLDISSSTTLPAFRVVLPDSTVFVAEDATSGAPVTVRRESGSFPVASGLARIVADATELRVSALPDSAARAARGSTNVTLASLRLENPGVAGITSDVQVSALGVTLVDTTGVPVGMGASYLSRIVLRTAFQTYASRAIRSDDGADLSLVLSQPLGVPVNGSVDVTLAADIADTSRLGAFRLRLQPPTSIEARDASSRDTVTVTYMTNPIEGAPVIVEAEAQTVLARGATLFPSSVLAGERDVPALRMALRHASPPGTGRIQLDSLIIQVRDETRAPRIPDLYLDRLRILVDGVEVANLTGLPASGGSVAAPIGGGSIEAGDSAVVLLIVDFSPSAPASFLELAIPGSGIRTSDANSGDPVLAQPDAGGELPLLSGLTRIASPPRDLLAGWQSLMPAALATDDREVAAATVTLRNSAAPGAGVIKVDRLRFAASDPSGQGVALGKAVRRLAAYMNGTLWARSDTLGADSTEASLIADAPLAIDAGSAVSFEIRLTPQGAPQLPSFRVGLDASGIGVVQPGSALLTVQVSPEAGSAFPFWSAAGSFTPASLAASWGNFPNPFAAGREATSFVYYLAADATVSLRVWTPTGDRVATLLDGDARSAGLHQSDLWNGRNGRGDLVRNGVYVAELVVHYANGSTERARRKVAVLR